KDHQFIVGKPSSTRKDANTQPATAPSRESIRLSTRKLPSTDRRRKPSARSDPTSRTREATCAYIVIIAPSVAPKEKKMEMVVPSTWMKPASWHEASS